jgi:hypothetical protein
MEDRVEARGRTSEQAADDEVLGYRDECERPFIFKSAGEKFPVQFTEEQLKTIKIVEKVRIPMKPRICRTKAEKSKVIHIVKGESNDLVVK